MIVNVSPKIYDLSLWKLQPIFDLLYPAVIETWFIFIHESY